MKNYISGELEIEGKKYAYELRGWIGVHATIESADASLNCKNYKKTCIIIQINYVYMLEIS